MSIYTCPCCGHITFDEFPGSYEICAICLWENDAIQLYYPTSNGGANSVSLIEAQVNYFQFEACEQKLVHRAKLPNEDKLKDPTWYPLFEKRINLPNPETCEKSVGEITSIREICYWLINV